MQIDFRSDTVTQPTSNMKEFMFQAPLGDDVFGEDPSIVELEKATAQRFNHEAGLFCPSGTMTNQIALAVHTRPREEVICHKNSHIYLYEGGGPAFLSSVSLRLLEGDYGRITVDSIEENINPENVHFPRTRLVSLENTMNKGGGSCYDLEEIRQIRKLCQKHGLSLHLDGARVFNACIAKGYSPQELGQEFDSISICFSKGLGAPVGSVLVGSEAFIHEARRVRKVLGGGMRQAGILASAAYYALNHHVDRLAEDHRRSKEMGEVLKQCNWIQFLYPIETNIIIFEVISPYSGAQIIEQLSALGIRCAGFGKSHVRLVYHLDISEEQHQKAMNLFQTFVPR